MSQVRLGLIGAGSVGVLHAEAASRTLSVRVTGVCDSDPRLAPASPPAAAPRRSPTTGRCSTPV